MDTKLQPKELVLYLAIDALLLNEWDPIGVSGMEGAEDEYQGYLPQVFKMVIENVSPESIADYLHTVVTERMELPADFEHQITIAKKALIFKIQVGL